MGPDHHHPPFGPHGDGYGFDHPGFGSFLMAPLVLLLLAILLCTVLPLVLWALRELGVPRAFAMARIRIAAGSRGTWRAALARHRGTAVEFAAYECSPQAVLHRPALADVRQPATARFVDAFAEACALATDRYPGRARTEAFAAAVDRAARAWRAAAEAAARPLTGADTAARPPATSIGYHGRAA